MRIRRLSRWRGRTTILPRCGCLRFTDPDNKSAMLAAKTLPGFPARRGPRSVTQWLNCPLTSALLDADAVIVTHTHDDHWDRAAVELIAKDKPIMCKTIVMLLRSRFS